ncbi:phosphate signaling complex protein PhoU [Ornithinimicrobium tianjinense]|uniref:Phosphate-specific transport system accessory protein PhoU n=1 Tax=Ornithinimicrobium tianjinense TaxID=1195761 RepID=A0A917BRV8_9MICO|nr:phosphate signaling complex protein PhoU [Ornithinimicrobium tianjinense]GGF56429.1 phosphate transport system regulatory protein PhoU [Ornithinimicrobium tianjinense]
MRSVFHDQLEQISDGLVELSRLASEALGRASTALLEADLSLAEQVISDDEKIDALRRQIDNDTIDALARQQPVATDLRQLVTTLRMTSDLERAGDLARHVAKLTRMRYPDHVLPAELHPTFAEMAQVAEQMVLRSGEIIATLDTQGAAELKAQDDTIDRLHRAVFGILLDERFHGNTQLVIDATLLSRYFERYADHAVSVATRVVYLVTGGWNDDIDPDDRSWREHEAVAPHEVPRSEL